MPRFFLTQACLASRTTFIFVCNTLFWFFAFRNASSCAPFLQELHVHNHIHSVWIAVYLAKVFFFSFCLCVCVCLQSICKSIMSERNHLSFILATKYKSNRSKLFLLYIKTFDHVPSISSIHDKYVCNTKIENSVQLKLDLELNWTEQSYERKKEKTHQILTWTFRGI